MFDENVSPNAATSDNSAPVNDSNCGEVLNANVQDADAPISDAPVKDAEAKRLVEEMFNEHRDRLLRMIEVRLQPELRNRVDANDVLQDSFMEAYRQLRLGVSAPKFSTIVWLRLIVGQQLVSTYRRYCQTQKRNVSREYSISEQRAKTDATSTSIFLIGKSTSPSAAARRHELVFKLRECLEKLNETDREILSLRHFEQLSNRETAEELKVSPNAASVMYLRALKKFRTILQAEKLDDLLE